jgi:hypothetical protein
VHTRNVVLLRAAEDIFGFRKGRSWEDFKKNISGKEIRQFYGVQASLWPPGTDWQAIMPQPDGKLRGLYLGDIGPELILRNLIRFSLYSDQLFILDPFYNPWILRPQYNPIENPDQFKADTLRLIYFLFQIAPWIEANVVQLVPDPGDFNLTLKRETWRLARARRGEQLIHEDDMAEARAEGEAELKRVIYALPEHQLLHQLERAGQKLTDQQKASVLQYAKEQLRADPLALEQPLGSSSGTGQIKAFRSGANLETALMIAGTTGTFLYTNMVTRWQEILSARDEMGETARTWSPFAKAFQSLQFRFLTGSTLILQTAYERMDGWSPSVIC